MPTYPQTGLSKGPAPIPGQRPALSDPRYTAPAPRPGILGAAPAVGRVVSAPRIGGPAAAPAGPTPAQLGMIDQNSSIYLQHLGLTAGAPNFGQSGSGPQARAGGYADMRPGNMPVGIVNGNQTYQYGPQGSYGGNGGTILADPRQQTYFNGTTAAPDWSFGRNTSATYGAGAAGGGAPGSRFGYGGAGDGGNPRFGGTSGGANGYGGGANGSSGNYGSQLQRDQDAANAANKALNDERKANNASGQAAQQGALDANYGNIYGTIDSNRAAMLGLLDGAGGTAHTMEDRRLAATQGKTASSLAGRGLYNSTVKDSLERGNALDSALIQGNIDEQANQQRLGVYGQTGAQMVGAQGDYARAETQAQQYGQSNLDRIIDDLNVRGPDASQLYGLLGQAGARGGAGAVGQPGGAIYNGGVGSAYGGGGASGAMDDPSSWVDQSTVNANQVARQKQAAAEAAFRAKNLGGTGPATDPSAGFGTGGEGGGGFGGGNPGDYGSRPAAPPLSANGYGVQYDAATGQWMQYDDQLGMWEPMSSPYL